MNIEHSPNPETIRRACKAAGGQSAVARALCLGGQGTVSSWIMRGKVPAEYVLRLEALSGVSRHELREDLYPREDSEVAA